MKFRALPFVILVFLLALVWVAQADDPPFRIERTDQGVVNAQGELILEPIYDSLDINKDLQVIVAEKNGLEGVFRFNGEMVLPVKYQSVSLPFEENSDAPWRVKMNDLYGVVDPDTGELVVPIRFDYIPPLEAGYILAKKEIGEHGFQERWQAFDWQGQPIPGVGTQRRIDLWEDAGWLIIDGHYLVDHEGNAVFPEDHFDVIRDLGPWAIVTRNGLSGLIDTQGRTQLPLKYAHIERLPGSREGWLRFAPAPEQEQQQQAQEQENRQAPLLFGVMDANGNVILAPKWNGMDLESVDNPAPGDHERYFLVRSDHHFGSVAIDGTVLIKPRYDDVDQLERGGAYYRVTENGKSGLCNLASGHCPLPAQYDYLRPIRNAGDKALYLAVQDGQYGLIQRDGTLVIPVARDRILEIDGSRHLTLLINDDGHWSGQTFIYKKAEGKWQRLPGKMDIATALAMPYDGHGVAEMMHATIKARYLPKAFATPQAVLSGYSEGKLRELRYPSLLLSQDQAYIFFGTFAGERRLLPNTLPLCRDENGFHIPLTSATAGKGACKKKGKQNALHFLQTEPLQTEPGQALTCTDCADLNLPVHWVRKSFVAACPSPEWNADKAQQQYQAWLQRWQADIAAFKAARESSDGPLPAERITELFASSVTPGSRATSFLVASARAGLKAPGAGLALLEFDRLFRDARPAGGGGLYPEPLPQFRPHCARVWYLDVSRPKTGQITTKLSYQLPPTGELRRGAWPFALFTLEDGQLFFAGVSRELAIVTNVMTAPGS